MKNLIQYIQEGVGKTGDKTIFEIENFLEENYEGSFKISNKPNKDGKYEVIPCEDIKVKNLQIPNLTNNLFVFGDTKYSFKCFNCKQLTTLEGAPEKVSGKFYIFNCKLLTTLEGGPKEVGVMHVDTCEALTTLEGAPEIVEDSFYCWHLPSLRSLDSACKKVGGDFECFSCEALRSLKGAPKEVGGDFTCEHCKYITKEDVTKASNVKGKISIKNGKRRIR